jgi:hypothetical protein
MKTHEENVDPMTGLKTITEEAVERFALVSDSLVCVTRSESAQLARAVAAMIHALVPAILDARAKAQPAPEELEEMSILTFPLYFYGSLGNVVLGQSDGGHGMYGCKGGHFVRISRRETLSLFSSTIGAISPVHGYQPLYQPQSVAKIIVLDGFAILALWDRTGYSRPNSSSNFIVPCEVQMPCGAVLKRATEALLADRILQLVAEHAGSLLHRIQAEAPITLEKE